MRRRWRGLWCMPLLLIMGCTVGRSLDSWTGYRDDVRYTLGMPFTTTSPTGQQIYVPASPWRASQSLGYVGAGSHHGKKH